MCEGTRVAYVTLVGNIIVGMFLVLPTENSAQGGEGGPSLQKQGAMVFKAILYGESALCIPYSEGAEDRTRQKRRLAAVELLGALIGEAAAV